MNEHIEFPRSMPILARDEITYAPVTPIFLQDKEGIEAANLALQSERSLVFITPKTELEASNEDKNKITYGIIGEILRKTALQDGTTKYLIYFINAGYIIQRDGNTALVQEVLYKDFDANSIEAMFRILKDKLYGLANMNQITPDQLQAIEETPISNPNRIIQLSAAALWLKTPKVYSLLSSDDVEERMMMLLGYVTHEIQVQNLQKEIKSRVHNKMDKTNKEFFLKEQMRQIQKELGIDKQRDEEIDNYNKKLESIKPFINKDAHKEIQKQINRLSRMHQDSGDANILQNYIEWVLEIPFGKNAKENLSIKNVKKQLENDHYSLDKPKKRIVEFFAVRELLSRKEKLESKNETKKAESKKLESKKDAKGTILCFYGPPGVGKTSLANSIAKATNRALVRIALGGLEDVSELRGHRRTYIGAMPGRIVQGLIEAKEMNPVMVLDEVDKIARSVRRGDPTSALLEILDPEQNVAFRDYYTNFSIDLSQIIFIATANDISTIPSPLRDRMEFISVSSYTPQEKEQIAKKYLIPQELKRHGLSNKDMEILDSALAEIIEKYTREAGVRNLRRVIASIMRKVATQILEEEDNFKKVKITTKNLKDYLDKIVFEIDPTSKKPRIGVVNGLAWTSVGGDLLKIEAIKIRGKGNLSLTGSLGEVMKESAHIAHSVVKVLIDSGELSIKGEAKTTLKNALKQETKTKNLDSSVAVYNLYDLHLHAPEGATPKDGPSAGIAMACVIASILSERAISGELAMTGELTLSGDVLAIGGLKEKLIAAYKAGVKKVLIPAKNYERDLDEVPDEVKNGLEIIGVKNIHEVINIAIEK